ncbi:hypothetical protein E1265_19360 [Streptomyces sp. 8K308]|uniref:acyltransferase family protein n=1 Tax=Streptomyces sp. 8K308 TaxID=2530388 RepID=UPI001052C050|nr:acyltransferase family protein [Streptomyces sp. 8K308]TDC20989.1 hypothetical protein E1265_19360 [Streptomyces sp. 8K308]
MTEIGAAREPRWDNLRYLAGTGVLLIHVTETLPNPDGLHWVYLVTWPMRVPLFALLAGYFSSATPPSRRRLRRLAETLLLPVLTVQLLAFVQIWAMSGGDEHWSQEVHGAAWTLWFLQALLLWRLALPWLVRLRYPLATAVAASLISGYLPLDPLPLAFSRAVGLLPFFLLGWKLRQGALDRWMRGAVSREAAAIALAVTGLAAWLLRDRVDRELLLFRYTYDQVGVGFTAPLDWTIRCVALLGGMVIALSLIRLIPGRRLPFVTYLGSGGLYIYLLHGLLLRPLNASDAFAWVDSWADQAVLLVLCVVASAALASPPIRRLAGPVVRPRLPSLRSLRRGEKATASG